MVRKDPVDFFRLFFSPEVIDNIYIQSSLYALYAEQQHHTHKDHLDHHPHAHAHDWVRNPLKRYEIEPLIAILLTMGVLGFPTLRLGSLKYNVPQHKINNYTITMFRSYWSTKWPFSNIMSGRRFELLMSYLHLNDTSQMPDRSDPNHDKLYRIRPFLDRIVSAFSEAYTPSRDIAVDESIIGFKGRLSWIQYMPKKPTKWGIKTWVPVPVIIK